MRSFHELKKSYHVLKAMVRLLLAAFFPAKKSAATTIALLDEALSARGFDKLSERERKRIWSYVAQGAITGALVRHFARQGADRSREKSKAVRGCFHRFPG